MAALTSTTHIHRPTIPLPSPFSSTLGTFKSKPRLSISPIHSSLSLQSPTFSDPFVLQLAETLEDSLPSSSPLQKLIDASSETLLSTRWPSRKDEPFGYTDTSFIKRSQIQPIPHPPDHSPALSADTQFPNLVIVDGFLVKKAFNLSDLSNGVFVGSLVDLSSDSESVVVKKVGEFSNGDQEKDLFCSINGNGAPI